jgi:uncharacterized membrane protein
MDQTLKIKTLPSIEHIIIYLVVIYVVGIVGMLIPEVHAVFIFLVPVNIILALGIVLLYHAEWNSRFVALCILIYAGGFLIELAGIKTGVIFGPYSYGAGLGLKVLEVPLVMGLNWLLLVYGATSIVQRYVKSHWAIGGFGAALMVLYDLFLEPSAIKYGFWKWETSYIPLQNYVAWFLCAFVFIYFFSRFWGHQIQNRVSMAVFWLQLIFFACILAGNNLT